MLVSAHSSKVLAPGSLIEGKYRVVRQIGAGGMGAVFEAEAVRLHKRVAIKVLFADGGQDEEVARRFQLEAQAAGRIGSRHIVEVIDLGQLESGAPFMVMEFLDGESLRGRIARGRMQPREILPIASQLLAGLIAAHQAGIVHRDLKPDNVFLVRQTDGAGDFVKLLDFGISKFNTGVGMSPTLTRTGTVLGTPYYMSPEQASGGKSIDHRVDIYAVGVILYEALTGTVPFQAETFNELLFKIVLEHARPVSSIVPEADPHFIALIERAMARDPAHRFQSAADMRAALDAWSRGDASVPTFMATPNPNQFDRLSAPGSKPNYFQSTPYQSTPGSWARNSNRLDEPEEPPRRRWWPWGLGLVGVAAIAGGLIFAIQKRPDVEGAKPQGTLGAENLGTAPKATSAPPPEITPPPTINVPAATSEPGAADGPTEPTQAVSDAPVASNPTNKGGKPFVRPGKRGNAIRESDSAKAGASKSEASKTETATKAPASTPTAAAPAVSPPTPAPAAPPQQPATPPTKAGGRPIRVDL
ncbi:MAG TPA: serine/threonine-protein kinase [Polyangiaceae bacterium]|nr:serine/threonine-protein kinase [Polyangiaceae bacterium]